MKNKEILSRVFANLGYEETDTKRLRETRYDLQDTLVEVFNLAEAPRKSILVPTDLRKEVEEDFADSTLISNLTLDNVTVSGGNAVLSSLDENTIIYITDSVTKVTFGIYKTYTGVVSFTINVKVLDEEDNELFSEDFTFLSDDVLIKDSYESDDLGFENPTNGHYKVVISCDAVPADFTTLAITHLIFEKVENSYELPEDAFIPLEVIFKSGNSVLPSKEMPAERFLRWNPNYIIEDTDLEVTEWTNEPNKLYYTSENLDYDGSIGYYLNADEYGRWTLYWKKAVDAQIYIWYSYLPEITTADADPAKLHRAYTDVIVYGCTRRGLLRKLSQAKGLTEVELASIRSSYNIFEDKYNKKTADIAGFFQRTVETPVIHPFAFLNDLNMELD